MKRLSPIHGRLERPSGHQRGRFGQSETSQEFVCNFADDKDIVFEMWAHIVTQNWDRLAPVAVILRRKVGDGPWENFEYLAVLAQDWKAAHPRGTYPVGVRRITVKDQWLEADEQYAASLAASAG
jgi:hypothetical protein